MPNVLGLGFFGTRCIHISLFPRWTCINHFSSLILMLNWSLYWAPLQDKPKFFIYSLTQSHQVFFRRPFCQVPSISIITQYLIQSPSSCVVLSTEPESWSRDHEFDSRPSHCWLVTLDKLFTPMCLCRCKWSSGGVLDSRNFHAASSNLNQIIYKRHWTSCWPTVCSDQLSLLPSAGWEMSCSLWAMGEGLVWLIGAVVYLSCCTVAPIVRNRGQWMAA